MKTHRSRQDAYQDVTNQIIAALEAGTKPWQRPWDPSRVGGIGLPFNGATGRRYSGINTVMLGLSPFALNSDDPRWCTYKQAADRNWQIRRGARGTTVFFFQKIDIEDQTAGSEEERVRRVPVMRAYTVFHAAQVDGIPAYVPPSLEATPWRRPEAAEIILKNSGAEIRIGGTEAYYNPLTDHIQLPPDSAFDTPERWLSVALHELGHHSGAKHRLNRDLSGKFGTASYAAEELRVEIAAGMIAAELNLPAEIPNHASYVSSWIKCLRSDRREFFRAAADAQKIADHCLAFHPDYRAMLERPVEPDTIAKAA